MAVYRVLRAMLKSKLLGRSILPKDIWNIKGLVCGGTDASIYRDQIFHSWGLQPLDVYVSTETCFMAMQSWDKKGMTFIPYRHFYEFIPEEEWEKSRDNKDYQPSTVLMNEVKEGKIYELVITNFHGGPFIRYRMGDLIKIISLKDEETKTNLPQMVFHSRADDIIDIAGFPRLDEKTIWNAIKSSEIHFIDWVARKEQKEGDTYLHVYIEATDQQLDDKEAARRLDQQLINMDNDYKDLKKWISHDLVAVTFLKQGSFAAYTKNKQASGADLSHWKPPHVNPSETVIRDLIN
jgi:phenylacetate-coenzyme A ligase PaaK-like adenylate-forming protein